jgi:filamentous hemagglutinin family protein
MKANPLWLQFAGFVALGFLPGISVAQAQIVPDNTLPVNSTVSPGICVACSIINGGTVRGPNLFHSFREFSIPTGGEAWFNNGLRIQNILTRVTGKSFSNIDGLIRANGTANLYLINPNGILFGPNARLSIGGSFVATTASSLKLPDGAEYSAVNPQAPPILSVNLTPGVQFGPRAPESKITNAGNLTVPAGQSITLLGGTTTSTGSLTAPGGTVQVLGDRVVLQDNARVDVSSPTAGGTALIGSDYKGQGTVPNATQTYVGPNAVINADATITGNGGKVVVWADDTTRFYGTVTARGGNQAGDGGFTEISGKTNLAFDGKVDVGATAGVPGTVLFDPQDINIVAGAGTNDGQITTGQITADQGGTTTDFQIGATALQGITGNIDLQASRDINLNTPLVWTTRDAGTTIAFTAGRSFDATNNGINQSITAPASNVSITANGDIKVGTINTEPTVASGNDGGTITITSNNGIIDTTTGNISSQIPNGNGTAVGKGGDVILTARGDIRTAQIDSSAEAGQGGSIQLFSRQGSIDTTRGTIFSDSKRGSAGDITLTSTNGSIQSAEVRANVETGGEFARSTSGNITLTAQGNITTRGSINSSVVAGAGDGGNITIISNAGNIDTRGGVVNSATFSGNGGNITFQAFGDINTGASGVGSYVTTDGQSGIITLISTAGIINTSLGSLISSTSTGYSGDIELKAPGNVYVRAIDSSSGSTENSGENITITSTTGSIFLNQSESGITSISNTTKGNTGFNIISISAPAGSVALDNTTVDTTNISTGYAGYIVINARDGVTIQSSTVSSKGNHGQIVIGGKVNDNFSITSDPVSSFTLNNSKISTDSNDPTNDSNIFAGTIAINARNQVLIQNRSEVSSTGNQGTIVIGGGVNSDFSITSDPVSSFTLNNSKISTDSNDPTNDSNIFAGTIAINARNQVLIQNRSEVSSKGNQGTIVIGGGVNFGTDGNSGFSITAVPVDSITLDRSTISTSSVDSTNNPDIQAGTIAMNARNSVLLQNSKVSSTGNQGTIVIGGGVNEVNNNFLITPTPVRSITLNNSQIDTSTGSQDPSRRSGSAGDININATSRITLNNSQLTATTYTGEQGGNINIDPNLLLLRNGSRIATNADNTSPGGGGNITIKAKPGFVVGVLSEKNRIIANASTGSGGQITIEASGVFGFLKDPANKPFNPFSPFSNINASSDSGPSGVITIDTLNIDPSKGLDELSLPVIDSSTLVAKRCDGSQQVVRNANRFNITGRSGIPASPDDLFNSIPILTELGTPNSSDTLASIPSPSTTTPPPGTIVEAQGWIVAPNGKIRLIAQSSGLTPLPALFPPSLLTCPDASNSPHP